MRIAAGNAIAFAVPGLHGDGVNLRALLAELDLRLGKTFLEPGLCRHDFLAGFDELVTDAGLHGLFRRQRRPLKDERQSRLRADETRQALRTATTGEEADLRFGKADLRFRLVGDDTVVTGERDLEAAAERRAVDRGGDRLAAGLEAAEQHVELEVALIHRLDAIFLRTLTGAARLAAHHGKVGTGAEGVLAGGEDGALDRVVAHDLFDDRGHVGHGALGEHVHRAVRHVPGDERDTVAVDFEFEVFVSGHQCLTRVR